MKKTLLCALLSVMFSGGVFASATPDSVHIPVFPWTQDLKIGFMTVPKNPNLAEVKDAIFDKYGRENFKREGVDADEDLKLSLEDGTTITDEIAKTLNGSQKVYILRPQMKVFVSEVGKGGGKVSAMIPKHPTMALLTEDLRRQFGVQNFRLIFNTKTLTEENVASLKPGDTLYLIPLSKSAL